MSDARVKLGPSAVKLVLAFAAVYVIWGSTYLAIKYAIETLPPMLMAGTRFIIAGGALYAWARMRGAARPAAVNWRSSLAIGGLLLLGGNGLVVLAERDVPSGLAALLIATEPLMVVLLDWVRPGGSRPSLRVSFGLVLGLVGMALLVNPSGGEGAGEVHTLGALMLMVATISWAAGSLYAARAKQAAAPMMAAAMQMLAGGALLLVVGLSRGEAAMFDPSAVSLRSMGAFFYLIVFGSLVGFTSYSWLLRTVSPSLASTYAYVNPVVAVLLGWALAGEAITMRTILAAAVIISAVIIITSRGKARAKRQALPQSIRPALVARSECIDAGD